MAGSSASCFSVGKRFDSHRLNIFYGVVSIKYLMRKYHDMNGLPSHRRARSPDKIKWPVGDCENIALRARFKIGKHMMKTILTALEDDMDRSHYHQNMALRLTNWYGRLEREIGKNDQK